MKWYEAVDLAVTIIMFPGNELIMHMDVNPQFPFLAILTPPFGFTRLASKFTHKISEKLLLVARWCDELYYTSTMHQDKYANFRSKICSSFIHKIISPRGRAGHHITRFGNTVHVV